MLNDLQFFQNFTALDLLWFFTLLASFCKCGRCKVKAGLPDTKLENKLIKIKK